MRPRSVVDLSVPVIEFRVLRSMPEQKWSPLPERTITPTLGFRSRDVRALGNSMKKSRDRALRTEGRLRYTLHTGEVGVL